MKSLVHIKSELLKDRKNGLSLTDLSIKYTLAKSTVSLWCKDIKLSKKARNKIHQKWLKSTEKARIKGVSVNKNKKIKNINIEYNIARNIIGKISTREQLIIGTALYWAEGSKKETGAGFNFINSDPFMIRFIYSWLLHIMKIDKGHIMLNLSINISHEKREREILKFWSKLLDFPLDNFGKTVYIRIPYKRIYTNKSPYYGMLRIRVRSSSWLRRRILGMIEIYGNNLPM